MFDTIPIRARAYRDCVKYPKWTPSGLISPLGCPKPTPDPAHFASIVPKPPQPTHFAPWIWLPSGGSRNPPVTNTFRPVFNRMYTVCTHVHALHILMYTYADTHEEPTHFAPEYVPPGSARIPVHLYLIHPETPRNPTLIPTITPRIGSGSMVRLYTPKMGPFWGSYISTHPHTYRIQRICSYNLSVCLYVPSLRTQNGVPILGPWIPPLERVLMPFLIKRHVWHNHCTRARV